MMWPLNKLFETKYGQYVDVVLEDWKALWGFAEQRKVRNLRFRASVDAQRALDREVDRLCASRPGDKGTLLLYSHGASANIFGQTKKHVKCPAKGLFDAAVRRNKAVCVWADEFCTSKLDVYGHPVRHPRETRTVKPPACRAERHAMGTPGCRCFCAHSGCAEKRTVSQWCAEHVRPQFQYDVCYHNHGQKHGHRMWNRDVLGALNIGCLFLVQSLELDPGHWKRGTEITSSPPSWAEIFGSAGHALPFSLPTTKLLAWGGGL